jgi:hypothetical protein
MVIMAGATMRTIPWPGPRPYHYAEREFFRGRDREINELRRRVNNQQLTILSGRSGTGKSSLIDAGLFPELLKQRERALAENSSNPWPALKMSGWGGVRDTPIGQLFRSRLREAVAELKERSPQDYELLSAVYAPEREARRENFVEDVAALCRQAGGLILIVDQFEEVLRAGDELAEEAVGLIGDVYKFERRAHLLLSLREEYNQQLHSLEAYTDALYQRTYFLKPMTYKSAKDAVQRSAEAAGIEIGPEQVARILDWLLPEARVEVGADARAETTGREQRSVDLLILQTILFELRREIDGLQLDPPRISDELLDRYWQAHEAEDLVGKALERWIEYALEQPAPGDPKRATEDAPALFRLDRGRDADIITGFVRRIASTMAPYLSSGDYKVAAEELSLMYEVLAADFARLVPNYENVDRALFAVTQQGDRYALDVDRLGIARTLDDVSTRDLSGLALEHHWTPADTAQQLVALYEETKNRLMAGNILKAVQMPQRKTMWELVHDQLGKPFSAWADRQRSTWEESIFSLTVRRGQDIYLLAPGSNQPREREVRYAAWQGCWISPRDDTSLDGFTFRDCNLQGTAFFKCDLRNTRFIDCKVDGVLFINCAFDHVLFERSKGNAMGFLTNDEKVVSPLTHLAFEDCNLTQMKMSRLTLEGPVNVGSQSRLYLCDFAEMRAGASDAGALVFERDAVIEFCAWDLATQAFIEIERGCNLIASGRRRQMAAAVAKSVDGMPEGTERQPEPVAP